MEPSNECDKTLKTARYLALLSQVSKQAQSKIASEKSSESVEGQSVRTLQQSIESSGTKKRPWTSFEDSKLLCIVADNNQGVDKRGKKLLTLTWAEIAEIIPNRSAKQCRERWCYNLDPTINQGKWTLQEDAILLKAHEQYFNQWAQIAKFLPGRTENAIKTRYKSMMRAKKREWTEEEDSLIYELLKKYGSRWDQIQSYFPNRTANALKTRFFNLRKGLKDTKQEVFGSPRQIWLNKNLITEIDINLLVKLIKTEEQVKKVKENKVSIQQLQQHQQQQQQPRIFDQVETIELPKSTTVQQNIIKTKPIIQMKAQQQQQQQQQVSNVQNFNRNINQNVTLSLQNQQQRQMNNRQRELNNVQINNNGLGLDETTIMINNSLVALNEAILKASVLSNEQKIVLMQQSQALFSSYNYFRNMSTQK